MKKRVLLCFVGIAFFVPSLFVRGAVFSANKESYLLGKNSTLSENLYVVSNNISLTGKLVGDVFGVGDSILVDGDTSGDLFLAGASIDVNSPVSGDVRVAGSYISIASSTKGDVIAFGNRIRTTDDTVIEGDAVMSGADVNLKGVVKGDLIINSNKAFIGGKVIGNIKANVGSLTIGKDAVILGKLSYNSPQEAVIEIGAQVEDISFKKIEGVKGFKQKAWVFVLGVFVLKFLALFVAGVIVLYLFRRFTESLAIESVEFPGRSLLIGFIVFVIVPLITLLLIASLFGGIIGIASLFIYISLISIAKILSVVVAGVWIYSLFKKDSNVVEYLSWKSVAVGSLFSSVLVFIPFVGWVINVLVFLTTVGVIAQIFYRKIWLNR